MEEYLEFAKNLAFQAGKIIKDNFNSQYESEMKDDATPVTAIDKQINQLSMDAVKAKYPEHGFMGEEGDNSTGREEYLWLCDPIDATKAFILGIPNSVYMLALMKDGQILLSVVYDPHADRLYRATKSSGAFCNDQPIHVNNHPFKGCYLLLGETNVMKFGEAAQAAGAFVELSAGTGHKCMMLASGHGSGILKIDASNYDVGPASLIIEEAGGQVTGLAGEALRYDNSLDGVILSNKVIHDDLIKLVKDNK